MIDIEKFLADYEVVPEARDLHGVRAVIEQLQSQLAAEQEANRWISLDKEPKNDAYYIATDGIICEWLYYNEVWYYAATKKPYPRWVFLRQYLPISMPVSEPITLPEGE